MDKGTGAVGPPRDGFAGADWLEGYHPTGADPDSWDAVRPFVMVCADRLDLDGGAGALRVVRVLARLSVWCLDQALPLDREVVLDPDTVERFVSDALQADRSRSTYRATLRRIGPLLTTKAPWEPGVASVARRQVALPYGADELTTLRRDALVQLTPGRVLAARALLALGAGAGIDGRWSTRVAAEDVSRRDGMVIVSVGEPVARTVPVLAAWEDEVWDLAASAGDEFLVGARSTARNRAGALAASLVVPRGHPRLSAPRLRSTWLVTHLAMGTRLPELARAAGMQGVTVLSDLLEFVPELDEVEALTMLRGRA